MTGLRGGRLVAPAGAPGVVRRSGALARRRRSFLSARCARRDGTVAVLVVSVVSYVLLYRRFDRVTLQPACLGEPTPRPFVSPLDGRSPVRHAIGRFIAITIRRSPLHQGLVVGLLAAAGGFVLNSLLNASGWHDPIETRQKRALINTLLWAPMTMTFLAAPAMRLAMWIPLDLRANWIFRLTEDEAGRGEVAGEPARGVGARGCSTSFVDRSRFNG